MLSHIKSPNDIIIYLPINSWILEPPPLEEIISLVKQDLVVLLTTDVFNSNDDDYYWVKNQHLLKKPTLESSGYLPFSGVWACKAKFIIETLKRKNNYVYRNLNSDFHSDEYFLELENMIKTYKTNSIVNVRHPYQWATMLDKFKPKLNYRYHIIKDYDKRHLYPGVYYTRNKIELLNNEYENEFFRILSDYTITGENIWLINIDMENENIELY